MYDKIVEDLPIESLYLLKKKLEGAVFALSVRSRKLRNVGRSLDWGPKIYYLKLFRASEGTLSRWSRLHLQSLTPTNPRGLAWWVMARSPFGYSKACAPAVVTLKVLMMIMIHGKKSEVLFYSSVPNTTRVF
jgi:hypothetical protein